MKNLHIKIYLLLIVAAAIWIGCKTSKQTEAERAYNERTEQIKLLADMRAKFPCDTTSTTTLSVDTVFEFMRKDSVVYLTPDDSIVYINKYHTIDRVITKVQTVLDMGALQAARDSIDNISFLFDAAISSRAEQTKYVSKLEGEIKNTATWRNMFLILLAASCIGAGFAIKKIMF